ncbi:unnamed protein product [Effrenium voratum]|nr:unnamed protein product [Effrenium voratum]
MMRTGNEENEEEEPAGSRSRPLSGSIANASPSSLGGSSASSTQGRSKVFDTSPSHFGSRSGSASLGSAAEPDKAFGTDDVDRGEPSTKLQKFLESSEQAEKLAGSSPTKVGFSIDLLASERATAAGMGSSSSAASEASSFAPASLRGFAARSEATAPGAVVDASGVQRIPGDAMGSAKDHESGQGESQQTPLPDESTFERET